MPALGEARPNRMPAREEQARSFEARRRVLALRRLFMVVVCACVCAVSLVAWKTGAVERWLIEAEALIPEKTELRGMQLAQVRVSGLRLMEPQQLARTYGLEKGMALMSIDLQALRARVEGLGWVREASVRREFPDTLHIRITERVPYALWQREGEIALIDRSGAVITRENVGRFAQLPLVVGKGAASEAAALEKALATQPAISTLVRAAVRVGERRWDLHLYSGVVVKLPEREPEKGLARLALAQRTQGVLSRAIEIVDLRLPDRLTVRLTPEAEEHRAQMENNT